MTERKRSAQTILVGCQGRPVHDNMHSVVPLLHMSTIHALQHHAPTLAETMRIAGSREGYLLSIGSSDELECLGYLPMGKSNG